MMKIGALSVDLGGVMVVNNVREVGEVYEKSDDLTKEVTSRIFRFIHTDKRTEEEIKAYLLQNGVKIDLWERFTRDFYGSEIRNDVLIEFIKKPVTEY